ncbi:MAG: type IV secretory system conjugative DNA transfer family protein [Lachnospiraceae bacterium]|nr:type IV secretory system conjugative DNA transfer family protein [Lachnospiraceae bacterium]
MKPKDKITFTGIWTFPIIFMLLLKVFPVSSQEIVIKTYLIYTLYSLIPAFLITIHNSTAYANGKREFGLFDFLDSKNKAEYKTYGYNPLYNITEESPIQDIYEVMQNISFSLIPLPAGLTEIFWKQSARNLLTGLLIYFFNQGCNTLIEIVDNILSLPIKQIIDHAIDSMNDKYVEYKILIQYKDMSENTLTGIYSELSLHISIFANDENIRYAFSQNPKMFSPLTLEEQYNIYLSIKEEKLTAYYDILQLIINQALMQLEKRHEISSPIIFIIDELPRLLSSGKLDRLLDGARTLRSRKVSLILVTQSIEALMTAYGENEVIDLISNCSYKIILSASSSKTQDMICKWCGKYKEQHDTFDKHTKKSRCCINNKKIAFIYI